MIRSMLVPVALSFFAYAPFAAAQTIDAAFRDCYSIRTLGFPNGVPGPLGGINFLPGNPDIMLIGGSANNGGGALYAVQVVRNANQVITGFAGPGVLYAPSPNIDGGLAVAPNDTLFVTTYSNNNLIQIPTSLVSSSMSLSALGVASSTGTCQFVPAGFPGASHLKIASYNAGIWYDFTISNPVDGIYTLTRNTEVAVNIGGGPEGIVFVGAGNPGFIAPSCVVSEYGTGRVVTYTLDINGDPIPSTRRVMITGLGGAEGGVRDPLTGNFLFSTYGGSAGIAVVEGFNFDCIANINGDCAVDFFDYLDFVDLFSTNAPDADFNHDNIIDFFDYLDFVDAFSSCGR